MNKIIPTRTKVRTDFDYLLRFIVRCLAVPDDITLDDVKKALEVRKYYNNIEIFYIMLDKQIIREDITDDEFESYIGDIIDEYKNDVEKKDIMIKLIHDIEKLNFVKGSSFLYLIPKNKKEIADYLFENKDSLSKIYFALKTE